MLMKRKKMVKMEEPQPVPTLPDNCWENVLSCMTENKDFFGMALVCKRWADIVRNSKTLESVGFVWDKTPAYSSTTRAELFLDWLGTRIGKKTMELELALVPGSQGEVKQAFRNSLWCTIGQMASTLRHLAIKANAGLVTDVGPWITSFTNLEYLLLAPRGNGLAVRTSLAGLSKLRDLVLSVKQDEGQEAEGAVLENAEHLRLEYPRSKAAWLPPSLTALRLECPTLRALPDCLSALGGLQTLELNTRSMLTNSMLILNHTDVRSLELSGCVPGAFLGHLSAFTALASLTLSHLHLEAREQERQLAEGLTQLQHLTSLSLSYCHLSAFPPVVHSLTNLAFLDISFNPGVLSFPSGAHVRKLELLAADWAAVAPDPSGLQGATALEELCLTDRPPTSEAVARVLRALGALPQLGAVYFDVGPNTHMTPEVVSALAALARDRPALQFKSLEDCLW